MSQSHPDAVENNTLQPQLPPSHPAPSAASGVAASSSMATGSVELLKHKNRLQEYTQRAAIPLPIYQTINEGLQHAPRFRSTVLVDGETYTSSNTFSHRKAAEQDVAKLALECISKKIKDEGSPLIYEDIIFCKSILNEFAVKINLERPVYITIQPEGTLPVFISSLVFNGAAYTGEAGKNKKEAEQLAARTVIRSLLGNSGYGTILFEIIKSKVKLFDALRKVKDPNYSTESLGLNTMHSPGNSVSLMTETGNVNHNVQAVSGANTVQSASGLNSVHAANANSMQATNATHVQVVNATHVQAVKATHVQAANVHAANAAHIVQAADEQAANVTHNVLQSATHTVLSSPTQKVLPTATHNVPASPTLGTSTRTIMPYHQFNLPKPDSASETVNLAISFVPAVQEQPLEGGPSTSRKRRKNKKKAHKRVRADDELAVVSQPLSQAPPAPHLHLVR